MKSKGKRWAGCRSKLRDRDRERERERARESERVEVRGGEDARVSGPPGPPSQGYPGDERVAVR